MQLSFALLALFQTPQTETPCTKLLTEFYRNEASYTIMQNFNDDLIKIDKDFGDRTGNYSDVATSQRRRRAQDERSLQQGDRIVALLVGQKCPLPDHVTSERTFSEEVTACKAAKGTATESDICDYVARAVALSFSKPQTARKPRTK